MKRTALALNTLTLALIFLAPGAQARAQTGERGASIWQVSELPARAKRWALVIGVDQYQDTKFDSLSGAANDARMIADALTRYAGFPDKQVALLTTDGPPSRRPTHKLIQRYLDDLAADVPKDGLLLLFFAGHGIEHDAGHAYLLPSDAQMSNDLTRLDDTAINVKQMRDYIRATGVRQVIIILDACRNDPVRARAAAQNVLPGAAFETAFNFYKPNREVEAFVTIYASAPGQPAYEDGVKRQGYFTLALVEGMSGRAKNTRGEVTLGALVEYVQKRVLELVGRNREQRPWMDQGGYLANQLVVAVAGPPPLDESNIPPRPTEPSGADDGIAVLNNARRRPSSQPNGNSIRISFVLFDCLGSIDPAKGCYLIISGGGWSDEEVRVTMNGRDISKQLTSQDDTSIHLDGNKESLNFINGSNEIIVRDGDRVSEPFTFMKRIK